MTRSTTKKSSTSTTAQNERTTRTGLMNLVRGSNIVHHIEYDVKSKMSQKALTERMYEMHVKWGNLSKAPTASKEPHALTIDDNTTVYISVITHKDNQCSMCGTWDKSDYCPLCKGEIVADDSVKADL